MYRRVFDAAQEFIKEQVTAKKPFFAYISTNAAHSPFHAPEAYSKPYAELSVGEANFLGMIANIDDNVGRMRSLLNELGIVENTIFIFTTDNGTALGRKVFSGNMRGNKGSEYDGGHRVPMFIHWPNGKLDSGRDVKPIAAHVDVLPTLLDLCGISKPTQIELDGRSLKPLLYGERVDWPDRVLITDSQRIQHPKKWRKSSVMSSRWRLVNQNELYDMQIDPMQTTNVANANANVVERLQAEYDRWWTSIQTSLKMTNYIYLGPESGETVCLNAHDWATSGGVPWNQAAVRKAMNNPNISGYWNVKVLQSGKYRVSLRRWPRESKAAIDAPLPPGRPVPGAKAIRMTPGVKITPIKAQLRIGDAKQETAFTPGSQEVSFETELQAGETQLEAKFITDDEINYGAYYVYVVKL